MRLLLKEVCLDADGRLRLLARELSSSDDPPNLNMGFLKVMMDLWASTLCPQSLEETDPPRANLGGCLLDWTGL